MAQRLKKVPTPYIDEHLEPSDLVELESEPSPLNPEPRGGIGLSGFAHPHEGPLRGQDGSL